MKNIIKKFLSGFVLCSIIGYTTIPVFAYTKDETVYSKIDSSGSSYKTIVSDHLENVDNEEELVDSSNLNDIKNVNGDESFSQNGYTLVWNANKNDIYYQGTTEENLPIEFTVTYKLNGKEMSAEDIVGKSGNVEITIEYKNNEVNEVQLDGENIEMYTPFIVICGTYVSNEGNSNIKITNGKAIDDGTKTILMGFSIPGMQETLGISKDTLEIPSEITISLDTECFELNNLINYVQPVNLEDEDLDFSEVLQEIYTQIDSLQQASNQLEEGANTLKDGTITYSEKSQEFTSAVGEVNSGVNILNSSYSQIDDGIATLNDSSITLQSGAKSVADGTAAVSENLNTIGAGLETVNTGIQTLQAGENELLSSLDQIIVAVNNSVTSMDTTTLEYLKTQNQKAVNTLTQTNQTLQETLNSVSNIEGYDTSTIEAQISANNNLIALLSSNVTAYQTVIDNLNTSSASLSSLAEYLGQLREGIVSLQSGTTELVNGVSTLKDGTVLLASKTQELSVGTQNLYAGTISLSQGTSALKSGSNKVKSGLNTLSSGGSQLVSASEQLTNGAVTLRDGATTLATGISEFNREGINKICNFVNNDVKSVTNRLEKLKDLSYNNFTMLDENAQNSEVRFILISDSLNIDDSEENYNDNKENIILNENKNEKEEDN